ncbi:MULTISPECIES: sugar ABC transporter ATP-binding protein [Bacillus]|uniref:Sugar ABC transporter ATP-binding protein n=2 Tax=Bacillus cereus group TaxID=86661 RepID=A0A2A7DE96_BACAN|nr:MULTISPECIES: sugar ABC transporter ATP-binding protein [Bacillus]MCP1161905.1 sugar ABC transporter ATP-binding protein [Bacillus sp. 1813sda1]MDC7976281.1 sugar ABC transporter ATP-binding protein [Bacillus sp. BLCC-B18]OTW70308.1 sugar ABC transporter ATP-binding protein [Bacillus thuringiensis serovar coreanensis]OTX47860.1 sugar ABC transporter ATP-binding protein [Bacillus thuringiensis serovar sooncheon]OTX54850.1 sugar ABC transporter ATP-binding protein [Bacillus thuringiensis sero
MSIHKHHARNAKRIFFVSVLVWIIVAIGLVMEYKKGMLFTSEKENLKLIGVVIPAFGLLIYSFIEKRRSKMLKQEIYNIDASELFEQQKFVVRKEIGIFQVITYFGLDGSAVGFLKEEYDLVSQRVWKAVLSFLFKGLHKQQFYLYNHSGERLLRVQKEMGVRNFYTFFNVDGKKIGELKQVLSLTKWEWIFLGVDGKEFGKVAGDFSATMQKIDWRDGTHIGVKEDGIPLEAVKYFSVSGGSLVTASISEQAELPRAVYYSVAAIVTIEN